MKTKRILPPTKVGARRPRRNFETSQKKVRDAIDAAGARSAQVEGKLVPIDVVIGKPGPELRAKIRDLLDV